MDIERRSGIEHTLLEVGSNIERHLDVAKYFSLFLLAQTMGDAEQMEQRKRQLVIPLVVKNRWAFWYSPEPWISHDCLEHHAMPYCTLKRLLRSIPRDEIEGKTVLDLFSGHGAVGFTLATGGLEGDVKLKQLIMLDNAYAVSWSRYTIFPNEEAGWWLALYDKLMNRNFRGYLDTPRGNKFLKAPLYCAGDASRLPIREGSIYTVVADPPFGILTKTTDPMGLIGDSLHEVQRVLRPKGNAYYLMPWDWTNDVMKNSPMHGTVLARNIGETWFDISLVKFTKSK